ncbi:hypothetical protein ACSNOH_27695 [Streptomyces sp. URMC 127]|uniref:hypothetical protein n=1 Tax=Streptomyces sp. URMC 127 TaxID=3423402 RepID=UPI003F1B0862
MTTREEVHALLEQVPQANLDDVAELIRQYLPHEDGVEPPYPRSLGMGHGPGDLAVNADRYLAEGGFGES